LYSHREKYGNVHHLVGSAFHNIGMVYLYDQKYPQALTAFQEAVSVRRSTLGSDHPAVAASLTKIGMIFLLQRDPEGAKEAFRRAMKVIKKSMGHDSMQMARILNNIGVAQYETGADSEAFQSFNEVRDIQERLLRMAKSEGGMLKIQTKTIELALANTLCNIGFLRCRQKSFTESYEILQAANALWKTHGGIFSPDVYCMDENLKHVRGFVQSLERREAEKEAVGTMSFLESIIGKMKCAS
jgi:tetratricopeptide (TPR) repeat protein